MLAIAGLVGRWPQLTTWVPGSSPMVMNTALCVAASGLGLWALTSRWTRLTWMFGAFVAGLAGVVLAQFVFGRSLGVDELFWRDVVDVQSTRLPGRMAANTAGALGLVGLALILMTVRRGQRAWLTVIGVGVLTLATLPLLNYLATLSNAGAAYRGMSVPTMVSVLLIAVAILRRAGRAADGPESFFPPTMAAAVSLLIAISVIVAQTNSELIESGRQVVRAHQVQASIERVVARVARMETNARGYTISGNETMRTASIAHEKELLKLLDILDTLVAVDPAQAARAANLRRRAIEKIEHNDTIIEARRTTGGMDASVKIILAPSAATANGLIALGNEMKAAEERLLVQREAETALLATNTRAMQIFGSMVALALVGLTITQTRRAAGARRAAEAETAAANLALSQRVSELARARAELETASRLQRAVLDGTVHSVISTTPEGVITSFNAGAEAMLGYAREEMVGQATVAVLHCRTEIAERAAVLSGLLGRRIEEGFETLVARARLGEADEREWTYVRKDGTRLPVSLSATALHDEAGAITGFLAIAQDLTERRQAEMALRESEEYFRRAFEDGGVGMALVDLDGRWLRVNRSLCDIVGYTEAELAKKTFQEITHPDDLAADLAQVGELLEGQRRTYRMEKRYFHRDGHVVWVNLTVSLVRDADGRPRHFVSQIEDCTVAKQTGEALRKSQQMFRRLFESSPDAIVLVGSDGGIVRANARAETLFGWTDGALSGQPLERLLPERLWGRHGAHLAAYFKNPHARPMGAGLELLGRRRDGTEFAIDIMLSPVEMDERTEALAVVRDISLRKQTEAALRESEERTRLFVAHAPAAVAMLDREMRYVVASREWLRAYRLTGELTGRSHYEVFPEISEVWKAIHRRCLAGAVEMNEAELFVREDGSQQWLRWEVRPWLTAAGEIGGIVMFTADISERKKLEESLAQARDQALEASRLKSEFLATISHEIRTPMNAVIGMAGLLVDTPLNADQEEMARTIQGGADSLLAIINDILDFSRIEAGRMRLDPAEFDFRSVVEGTVALLAQRAHEKGVELACAFEPAPTSRLLGDSGRVRQILTNLIGNAIKFTDVGEVDVRVRVVAESESRTRLRVTVRDTGVGVPLAAQRRLFQPFTQVDGSPTRRFGGTGLGLAISRQLVELMGGTIGFESEPEKGSVFWFELEFPRRGPVTVASIVEIPAGRAIFVVDDNATNRRILTGQLSRWGVRMEAVADGATALARLRDARSGPWHLILLDWQMPGMSGLELAVELRADPVLGQVPLVMLSSAGPASDVGTAMAVGFAAFLAKPVTPEQLGRCIARVLAEPGLAAARTSTDGAAGLATGSPTMLTAGAVGGGPIGRSGKRLLLAEDNPANQRVATMLLEKMGFAVTVAANGQRALAQLEREKFDAVMMDCQMPVLDGYEAARRIRAGLVRGVDARLPIIALTAYARPEDRARCIEAGMDDYVTKPIRPVELRAALQRCGLAPGEVAPAVVMGTAEASGPAEEVFDQQALETARGLKGLTGPSLLPELITMYLSDEAERLEEMGRLANERKGVQLGDAVHSFGGNAASFGGTRVRQVALEAEQAARAGDWHSVSVLLDRLRQACARLRAEVARLNLTMQ